MDAPSTNACMGTLMPWYHGWNVLAVAMLFQAVAFGIGIYSFTFWVAPWSEEFAVGRGRVMTVFLTMQVAMGLFSPLAGRAVDRLSIRGLTVAGSLCLAGGLALAGRAGALWHLNLIYGTLIVAGMLLAGPLAGQTLAARWFTRRRGIAIGVVTAGTSGSCSSLHSAVSASPWVRCCCSWTISR